MREREAPQDLLDQEIKLISRLGGSVEIIERDESPWGPMIKIKITLCGTGATGVTQQEVFEQCQVPPRELLGMLVQEMRHELMRHWGQEPEAAVDRGGLPRDRGPAR